MTRRKVLGMMVARPLLFQPLAVIWQWSIAPDVQLLGDVQEGVLCVHSVRSVCQSMENTATKSLRLVGLFNVLYLQETPCAG